MEPDREEALAAGVLRHARDRRPGQRPGVSGPGDLDRGCLCRGASRGATIRSQPLDSRFPIILCDRSAVVSGGAAPGAGILAGLFPPAQSGTLWHEPVPAFAALLVLHSRVRSE